MEMTNPFHNNTMMGMGNGTMSHTHHNTMAGMGNGTMSHNGHNMTNNGSPHLMHMMSMMQVSPIFTLFTLYCIILVCPANKVISCIVHRFIIIV